MIFLSSGKFLPSLSGTKKEPGSFPIDARIAVTVIFGEFG